MFDLCKYNIALVLFIFAAINGDYLCQHIKNELYNDLYDSTDICNCYKFRCGLNNICRIVL